MRLLHNSRAQVAGGARKAAAHANAMLSKATTRTAISEMEVVDAEIIITSL